MAMTRFTIGMMTAALLLAGAAGIAQTAHDHDAAAAPAQQMPGMDRQKMMMDHQKMMADMKAEQAKLDDLVAQMNAATGPGKVDRIAAVVNEMAGMHKRMMTMMDGMAMHEGMMQGEMKMHVTQAP